MSNFTPSVTYKTEFDGGEVLAVMRRLKMSAAVSLSPYLEKTKGGEVTLSFSKQSELSKVLSEVLTGHIITLELKDADGKPVTLETVLEESYFQALVYDLMTELFVISQPSEGLKKKQTSPSGDTTA